jgi:hypothetical protein
MASAGIPAEAFLLVGIPGIHVFSDAMPRERRVGPWGVSAEKAVQQLLQAGMVEGLGEIGVHSA